MWTGVGRPRSACTTCKGQKVVNRKYSLGYDQWWLCIANQGPSQIRCSGERPICNRCSRLRRTCVYSSDPPASRKSPYISASARTNRYPSPPPINAQERRHRASGEAVPVGNYPYSTPVLLSDYPEENPYLGISKSLIYTLVEVYYENAYNARLLLHKGLFLESLAAGTANPHVVLSVCAWAAKYSITDPRCLQDG